MVAIRTARVANRAMTVSIFATWDNVTNKEFAGIAASSPTNSTTARRHIVPRRTSITDIEFRVATNSLDEDGFLSLTIGQPPVDVPSTVITVTAGVIGSYQATGIFETWEVGDTLQLAGDMTPSVAGQINTTSGLMYWVL